MRSDQIKRGIERAPHRALLKATGVTDADMDKPFIAIVNSKWLRRYSHFVSSADTGAVLSDE